MDTLVKSLEEKVSTFDKTLKTILPIFLSLQDKVNKHEKRLQTIEEHKNKASESDSNVLNEDKETISQYKQLEDLINTN